MSLLLSRYRWGILYSSAVSVALVAFGSQLFRTLGFEYSALSALALSMYLPFMAATRAAEPEVELPKRLLNIFREGFAYAAIPLSISMLSLVWMLNCAFADGLAFYIQIVVPTTLIALLLGITIGLNARSHRRRIFWVIAIWVATLLFSFVGGYTGPQIFTFGWQYGYFPGFVWDEAMELRDGYWLTRAAQLSFVLLFFFSSKPLKGRRLPKLAAGAMLAMFVTLTALFGADTNATGGLAGTKPIDRLDHRDSVGIVRIHYSTGLFTPDTRRMLAYELRGDLDSICTFYHIPKPNHPIHIFIYRSADQMDSVVGTRNASISKPWQWALHIAIENIRSLKHELTHVLLAEYGRLPFDVSYSTGLTEGAAEAASPEFDGIRSMDELAASIIHMKLATGVSDVMSFTGFASNASSKSYILAGSFASFLIEKFGPEKYLKLYSSLDYSEIYGASLAVLEKQWMQTLTHSRHDLSTFDSIRIRYYFDRPSIVAVPCLRRIGKLMRRARIAFTAKEYPRAESLYTDVLHESASVRALQGRISALMRMHRYRDALTVLDTTRIETPERMMMALHILQGDLIVLSGGSITDATTQWQLAAQLELSADQVLTAGTRIMCLARTADLNLVYSYLVSAYDDSTPEQLSKIAKQFVCTQPGDQFFAASKSYLLGRLEGSRGELRPQMQYLEQPVAFGRQNIVLANDGWTSIFFRLICEQYDRLSEMFSAAN